MTTTPDDRSALPDDIRWRLRAMRQPVEPVRDLWPAIAARLEPQAAPRPAPRFAGFAIAATLAVAIGAGVLWRASVPLPASDPVVATVVTREADVLTRQYEAALEQMPDAAPRPLRRPLNDLDRNAELIRAALAHDPDSRLLLEQLRRTYARRLALSQRAAMG